MHIGFFNTQRALSPTQISLAPFVINPYRGCSMGCIYCYAKCNKVLRNKRAWGRFLEVKENIVTCLLKELKFCIPSRVLIGSTCEPFIREEKEFHLTKDCLKILNSYNIPYTILTRSLHIQEALDIISKNKRNRIYFTLNFLEDNLKRKFEPYIDYSLREVVFLFEEFKERDINFRIYISPLIGKTLDLERIISKFQRFTSDFFIEVYNPLMGSWKEVKKVLREVFPQSFKETVRIFEDRFCFENFKDSLKRKIDSLRRKFAIKLSFFIPEFDSFYTPRITYENDFL